MTIVKEPIKVICVKTKSSKKLIKGAIYLATNIGTNPRDTKDRHIRIPAGLYDLECFTTIDGKSLKNEPDFNIEWKPSLDIHKIYTNQCVRCRYSSGKILKNGEIYFVENQRTQTRKGWNGTIIPYIQLKIRGIKNWVTSSNFEEMHIAEQRKIKLKSLNGEKVKTGESTRKFLLYTEKEKILILFNLLSSSLIDVNGAELIEQPDISKMMLNKGKQYNIIEEDIAEFVKNIKSILIPFNFVN
jgi:hypothetical protein